MKPPWRAASGWTMQAIAVDATLTAGQSRGVKVKMVETVKTVKTVSMARRSMRAFALKEGKSRGGGGGWWPVSLMDAWPVVNSRTVLMASYCCRQLLACDARVDPQQCWTSRSRWMLCVRGANWSVAMIYSIYRYLSGTRKGGRQSPACSAGPLPPCEAVPR